MTDLETLSAKIYMIFRKYLDSNPQTRATAAEALKSFN